MTLLGKTMNTELRPCAGDNCFEVLEVPVIALFGRSLDIKVLCNDCEQKMIERQERDAQQLREDRARNAFDSVCPPLYRESDLKRIHGDLNAIATNWQYGPTGVFMEGRPGTGKTRAGWHILKRMAHQGKSIYGLTSTQFAKYAADQWHSNAEEKGFAIEAMERCRRTSILLLDDLGKQKMTERGETELYDVLEHRTTNLKPTIITTNATSIQLGAMLSEDRRQPILRRIKDFSTIIKI